MRTDILQQAQAIRASMDAAASVLTDEQAAKAPRLYPTWAAGLAVKAGDRLYYPGTDRFTRWSATTPHRQTGHRTLYRPCIPSSTWRTPVRRTTPSLQSGAWSTSTACTTQTARTASCTCASAPERRRAVRWYCSICPMSLCGTTSRK